MSTPLFIREPLTPSAHVLGKALEGFPHSLLVLVKLIRADEEATLVEEIQYSVNPNTDGTGLIAPTTDAGSIMLYMSKELAPSIDDDWFAFGSYPVEQGVSQYANGRIKLNLTLGVGCSLWAIHNIQLTPAGVYVYVDMTVIGGIVR